MQELVDDGLRPQVLVSIGRRQEIVTAYAYDFGSS
jgi:hypothetical protein